MKKESDSQEVWLFKFCVESVSGEKLERAKAQLLMEKIIDLVEKHDCQMGGGYREVTDEDFKDYPVG